MNLNESPRPFFLNVDLDHLELSHRTFSNTTGAASDGLVPPKRGDGPPSNPTERRKFIAQAIADLASEKNLDPRKDYDALFRGVLKQHPTLFAK